MLDAGTFAHLITDSAVTGATSNPTVVHRVIGVRLVEQPDLHAVADREPPVDRVALGPGRTVDQLPARVGIGIPIPSQELVGFTVVAILAGIGAAIIPARRASRLNVLDALQYE